MKLLFLLPFTALLFYGCAVRAALFPGNPQTGMPRLTNGFTTVLETTGRKAYGYLVTNGGRLLVLFHGNASTVGSFGWIIQSLAHNGFTVLCPEYPGFGAAKAYTPNETDIYHDVETLITNAQFLTKTHSSNTVFLAHSMGTGVAVEMAARGYASRMVLLAPFLSLPDAADAQAGFLGRIMVRDIFDSRSKAPRIPIPVLVIHGGSDEVIPVEQGKTLSALFPDGRYISYYHLRHNLPGQLFQPLLWTNVRPFLTMTDPVIKETP